MCTRKNQSVIAFVFLSLCFSACDASTCTIQESIKVEKLVHEQRDWNGVYGLYLKYPECRANNVVEVWERYSEVIAGLLANHWEQFGDALKLTHSDAGFKKFVLDHVADQTLPGDVLKQIKVNAKAKCPASGANLCAEIEKAAE
jgi:hypothetical protein